MKRFIHVTLFLVLACQFSYSEIIYESGSLKEFIGGNSPTTAYDNYTSHVSEGIADEGYNDYGPDWLDVQTPGFGNYRVIDNDDYTLTHWRNIFTNLLQGNIESADQMLSDSLSTFNYDLVEFTDTDYDRTYYMVRERLDSNYVDYGLPEVPDDTVIGSFRNGWGLFILNPNGGRQQVIVEIPHPCDDFISPYIGTDIFLQNDALAMMIAGAGREVVWNQDGNYSNNKSISDPSRNWNTVFEVYHEVLCDSLVQIGPHSPIVFHVHSFDDNDAHEGFRAVVLSAGWDAGYANKPVRDVTDDHLDLINFTDEIVHPANTFGVHEDVIITDFYQVHYSGDFFYYGAETVYSMPHTYVLLGPNTGIQMNYLRQFFDNRSVYEPWIQLETHEKPVVFDEMEMPLTELYAGDYPTSYRNFSILIDYYQPLIVAIERYLVSWESIPDTTAPPQITDFQSTYDGYHYVELEWQSVEDTNFKTYRVFYDEGEVTEESPFWDVDNDSDLLDMRENSTMINQLVWDGDYYFKVQGIDHFDNASILSESTTDSIPGHQPHIVIENFDDGEVELSSWGDQDEHPDSWSLTTTNTFMGTANSLYIWGNTWKAEEIEPHQIADGDVWQVSMYTESEGEIQGFGLQDSINTLFYSFSGEQLLDIEEWIPVYQGYFPTNNWNIFHLPIADDWFAFFDYFPELTSVIYINDRDDDNQAQVYFDEVVDITPVLAISPQVEIEYSIGNLYRNPIGERNVDVQFTSNITDPDSDTHEYYWHFGDGETSSDPNPAHTFVVEDDHPYTVLLQVVDPSGYWGNATVQIEVDQGETSYPITMNFVGDIILCRGLEGDGGIIPTLGVEAIFEPTLSILGDAADITVANLECPLTVVGEAHPTKSVVFKGHPDNAAGLSYAGIDIITLANNHTTDYGLEGLVSTQNVLADEGILFSGAGVNSYEANLPLFYDHAGINIAFLANSDRTGQYNNAQPYLQSGLDKPGFAYMTPYYLLQQIEAVQDVADLIVMEMHAGSEYSTEPGAGYDSALEIDWDDPQDLEAPREDGSLMDKPDISDEEENYSPRLDVPHVWDREIRHFAIDSGADLVVIHHPHRIQGFEVYNGKLIAHSIGNFVFDLSYHETFPSVVLNSKIDETGFYEFPVTPVYIDDYIPLRAEGQLGLHILDYLALKSRELDTYFYVDREEIIGYPVMDTLSMPRIDVINRNLFPLEFDSGEWISPPVKIHKTGNISSIQDIVMPGIWEYRLGKELIWYGNMEDEGSTQWNTNSDDEWFDEDIAYEGERSITHRRVPGSGDNIITNFENRIKIDDEKNHSVAGYIKTQNGDDVTIQIRYYTSRTSSYIITTHNVGVSLDGDNEWAFYYNDTNPPSNANYFDIRVNSDMPSSGEARSWFDNVSVIVWTDWQAVADADSIFNPNDYYFLQVKNSSPIFEIEIEHTETIYTDVPAVVPDFTASETGALPPAEITFTNTSPGVTAWFEWDFGDGESSIEENPTHTYSEIGTYDVSLSVMDYDGNILTETKNGYINIVSEYLQGDVNFDEQLNILDIVMIVSIVTGTYENPPQLVLELADMDQNGEVNILDIVQLINIVIIG